LREHGHSYEVEVTVSRPAPLGLDGMVLEASLLDERVTPLVKDLDHQQLHKLTFKGGPRFAAMVEQPTAENIAIWLFSSIKNSLSDGLTLERVRVAETARLYAEVTA